MTGLGTEQVPSNRGVYRFFLDIFPAPALDGCGGNSQLPILAEFPARRCPVLIRRFDHDDATRFRFVQFPFLLATHPGPAGPYKNWRARVTFMHMTDGHSMYALCRQAPVIPMLEISDLSHAAPLATALVSGGLPVIEVTLRTPVALDAITIMRRVAGATVGAATVVTPADAAAAHKAGAQFAVSPGWTHPLIDTCENLGLPLLPGASTAAEAMMLFQRGYDMLKFFPAEAVGGAPVLRALGAPLPQIRFCPTGGITADNAADYLALPNVVSVGGDWMAPPSLLREEGWGDIRDLAYQARHLSG